MNHASPQGRTLARLGAALLVCVFWAPGSVSAQAAGDAPLGLDERLELGCRRRSRWRPTQAACG